MTRYRYFLIFIISFIRSSPNLLYVLVCPVKIVRVTFVPDRKVRMTLVPVAFDNTSQRLAGTEKITALMSNIDTSPRLW